MANKTIHEKIIREKLKGFQKTHDAVFTENDVQSLLKGNSLKRAVYTPKMQNNIARKSFESSIRYSKKLQQLIY